MAMPAGAKRYSVAVLGALAVLASGCAGIERFAPPGIVKYEDLSGDQPQNPEILARVVERKAERQPTFPNLSDAPQAPPVPLAPDEQDALKAELVVRRDALAADVEADAAKSAADREALVVLPGAGSTAIGLEAARDALAEKAEADDARARAERGLAPRQKPLPD